MEEAVHAVIFDVDGTLLDSSSQDEQLYKVAVEDVLGRVSFRAGLNDYEHVTDSGILLQVLADNRVAPDEEIIEAIKNRFFELLDEYIERTGPFREMPGAQSILRRLGASRTHGVAIATGSWRTSAEVKLRTAGFDPATLLLATSDDASTREAIMERALQLIGRACDTVTYYGDGIWDQRACASLGWQFRPVGSALGGLLSYDDEFLC